jgi:hypothetical protein
MIGTATRKRNVQQKKARKGSQTLKRVWKGNADLEPLLVPIGELKTDPDNARRHPERNQQSIRRSLESFGQQKPVVVDSKGVVRAGNGTLEQARDLGWTHLARTRSELSDQQLKAYAIADNTSSDFAEFDPDILREQLEQLDDAGFDLDAAGLALSEVDLEDLGAAFGEDDKGSGEQGDKGDQGGGCRGDRRAVEDHHHLHRRKASGGSADRDRRR